MILVDSSVWIDFFNGKTTRATDYLRSHLGTIPFAIGDLMLAEVLSGFGKDSDFHKAKQHLEAFSVLPIGGEMIAIKAAQCYRYLRKKGVTVRGTIDTMIGAYCVEHKQLLLYSDRDFDAMVKYCGLKSALTGLN